MRILLVTDSLFAHSAYAIEAKWLGKQLVNEGYEVVVMGASYHGEPVVVDSLFMIGGDAWMSSGASLIDLAAQAHDCDVIFTFKDPYIYPVDIMRQLSVPWVAFCPIDTEPVSQLVLNAVQFASSVMTPTRVGQKLLSHVGINAFFTPHGYDPAFYFPNDPIAARDRLGFPQEVFIASCVGYNNVKPSRKNFERLIEAWSTVQKIIPDSILYLHTNGNPDFGGVSIPALLEMFRINSHQYVMADQYRYLTYQIPHEFLRDVYWASDILISLGNEGFGIPALHAQACGTPVLAMDFGASREVVRMGWRLDVGNNREHGDLFFSPSGGYWGIPTAKAIVSGVVIPYQKGQDFKGQVSVSAYQYDNVWTFWKEAWQNVKLMVEESKFV